MPGTLSVKSLFRKTGPVINGAEELEEATGRAEELEDATGRAEELLDATGRAEDELDAIRRGAEELEEPADAGPMRMIIVAGVNKVLVVPSAIILFVVVLISISAIEVSVTLFCIIFCLVPVESL